MLVPLVNLFNYYLTYSNISFSTRTVLTFTLDTLEGYAAWGAVHFIIVYLDRKYPYKEDVLKRLLIQLVTTLSAAIAIIIGLTFIINYCATDSPLPVSFYKYDIVIISIWFFAVNGIYTGLYFYREWQQAEQRRIEENKIRLDGFKVRMGKQELLLSFAEIAGFWVDGEYVGCCTVTNRKYIVDQSIDRLEKNLPGSFFFRLNRQFLVHRQSIAGFERGENGKLNVQIKPSQHLSPTVTVSRTKASDFREWFQ